MKTPQEIIKEFEKFFLPIPQIKFYQKLVDEGCEPDWASHLADEYEKEQKSFFRALTDTEARVREEVVDFLEGYELKPCSNCGEYKCRDYNVLSDAIQAIKK